LTYWDVFEGSGSWIVAYAEEQESRFQASFKPTKHVQIVVSCVIWLMFAFRKNESSFA